MASTENERPDPADRDRGNFAGDLLDAIYLQDEDGNVVHMGKDVTPEMVAWMEGRRPVAEDVGVATGEDYVPGSLPGY